MSEICINHSSYLEKANFFCQSLFQDIFCIADLFLNLEENAFFGLIIIRKENINKKCVFDSP